MCVVTLRVLCLLEKIRFIKVYEATTEFFFFSFTFSCTKIAFTVSTYKACASLLSFLCCAMSNSLSSLQ